MQTLLSLQVFGVPGRHAPAAHTSLSVQPLPSSQAAVLFTNPQPVVGEQKGDVHGLLSSGQVMAEPAQTPLVQTSPLVQGEPSLHELPGAAAVKVQPVAGAQLSTVQALPSLQASVPVPVQVPPAQVSPVVHALPSLHVAVLLTKPHCPVEGSQTSVVQTLPSLQLFGVPP